MITSQRPIQDAARIAKWQFGVRSLLWLMLTAGMCLAYARLFGMPAMWLMLAIPPAALLVGAILGGLRHVDAVYWAVLGAILAGICVIPANVGMFTSVLWPWVGALTGAYAGVRSPRVTWRAFLLAAIAGLVLVARFQSPFGMGGDELLFDLGLIPVAAVSLVSLIRLVEGLRAQYHTSRDAWAAGLVLAVMAGNLVAATLGGRLF